MKPSFRPRPYLASALLALALAPGCSSSFWVPPGPTAAEIPVLEARVQADPADADAAIRLAQAYRAAERYEDARSLLEPVVERGADRPTATFLLGATYEDLERYGEARTLYRAYIDSGASGDLRDELERRLPLLQRRELEATVRTSLAREAELANTPPRPWTVAVFPFRFVGADEQYAPLGRALSELLVADLAETERLTVLERAHVQLLLDEMRLAENGVVDPATAARAGRILGTERVIQGTIDGGEADMQLETAVVMVAAPTGTDVVAISDAGRLSSLLEMQDRVALRIYESLGIQLTATERARITQQPTENVLALVAFGLGLEAEDAGRFGEAAGHFAEAARLDPAFAAAQTSLDRSTSVQSAAEVNTKDLAANAASEGDASAGAGAGDMALPAEVTRDAVAEILRTEGVVASPTILELIFRRN